MDFRKEHRYCVLKIKDVEKLPEIWTARLNVLCGMVNEVRTGRGRNPIECVVVEHDWSIYDAVWKLVETEHNKNEIIKKLKRELEIGNKLIAHLEARSDV